MNTLLAVTRKELLDFFRDRNTMLMALFMGPALVLLVLVGLSGIVDRKVTAQLEKALEVPVINAELAPNLMAWLEANDVIVLDPPEDPRQAILAQRHEVILRIADDYAEAWRDSRPAVVELLHDSTRQDAQIPLNRISGVLQAYAASVGTLRLMARGIDPAVREPLRVSRVDLSTPEARAGQLMAFLPYLLILSAFLGGAYLVIDVTAGERERQSLEPLLVTPASREAIMSGKIFAACLVGLLSLLLLMLAFRLGFQFAPGLRERADVSFVAIAQILVVLTPMLLIGTTLLTLIAASVKSVKEAQSYMTILMFLPIVPTIYLMISPVKTEIWQFAVPFLAQNQAIMRVLRGEPMVLAEWAVYLGAGFALGLLLWLLASRLYHREKLAISA